MASNEIAVFFKGRVGVAESLYKYDYGIVLVLEGIADLPSSFDGWYETQNSEEAIPVIGSNKRIAVPNACLDHAGKVTLHIPIHATANDSRVEYIVTFRVIGRARPDDFATPDQENAIATAMALLNNRYNSIPEEITEYYVTQDRKSTR